MIRDVLGDGTRSGEAMRKRLHAGANALSRSLLSCAEREFKSPARTTTSAFGYPRLREQPVERLGVVGVGQDEDFVAGPQRGVRADGDQAAVPDDQADPDVFPAGELADGAAVGG